jgi:uncharacterized protein YbaP (TraB family)
LRGTRLLTHFISAWLASASLAQALPLWEVQGTANRVFLLGSIHFLRTKDYPLPQAFTDTYAAADIVVMEIDLSRLDPAEMLASIQRLAIDSQGRDLEKLLGARAYRNSLELAAEIDIDLVAMSPFEPWYAAMQITQLRLMQLGFDGAQGVDNHLLQKAMRDRKEVRGLETLEDQLGALDSLPLEDQRSFLLSTLEEAAVIDTALDNIVAAWKLGDVDVLETELMDGLGSQKKLYQQIVVQRNENWTASIIEFTKEPKNYLVVVGAMHLVGNDSVIRMLEDAGFSAKQIKP